MGTRNMVNEIQNKTSILHAKELPYFFVLAFAAISWIVAQSTDRLLSQPVLEVETAKVRSFSDGDYQCGADDKQESFYFRVTLTSLAPNARLDSFTAYLRTPGDGAVKAGRILESAPSWSQIGVPTCSDKFLTFHLQGIQPFASVAAEMVTSSEKIPIFHFESTDPIYAKRAGLETWIAKNEIAIYAALLVLAILVISVYAIILGRSYANR